MLSKYINTTKKKIVATTLAFTFAFSTSAALITSIQSNATDDIQGKSDSISEVTASDAEKAVLEASVDLVLAKTPEAKAKAEAALDDAVAKESAEDSNGSDGTSDSETTRLAKKYYDAYTKVDETNEAEIKAKAKWREVEQNNVNKYHYYNTWKDYLNTEKELASFNEEKYLYPDVAKKQIEETLDMIEKLYQGASIDYKGAIDADEIDLDVKEKQDELLKLQEKINNAQDNTVRAKAEAEYDKLYEEFVSFIDRKCLQVENETEDAKSKYLEAGEATKKASDEFTAVEEELIDAVNKGITTQENLEAELAKMGLIL